MVLVEVRQPVVEEDWRPDVFRNIERQRANGSVDIDARAVVDYGSVLSPHWLRAVGAIRGFEVGRHFVRGYELEIGRAIALWC